MEKRGQLAGIEFHYFIIGFFTGIASGLLLVYLGTAKIIGFQVPVVCGFFKNKKAQLVAIEFHFALAGFVVGIIGALILVYLGQNGIIPFQIPVCGIPSPAK